MGLRARPGASWYRFAQLQMTCRACGVELRSVVTPAGWALYTAMTSSATAYTLYWFVHPQQLLQYSPWSVMGVVLVVLPFILPCALWAETYVLAGDADSRRAKHAL